MLPLSKAVMRNNNEIVEYLLEKKADAQAVGEDGSPALSVAAALGEVSCLDSLLNAGALMDARDKDSLTPLMTAAAGAHKKFVEALLERKAAVDTADKDGNTALLHACVVGARDVVEVLLAANASCEIKNKAGKNARQVALDASARGCVSAIDSYLAEQEELEKKRQLLREEYEKSLNLETIKRLMRTVPFDNWSHADCVLLFKTTEGLSQEFINMAASNSKITGEFLASDFSHNFFKDEMGCKPTDGFAAFKAVKDVLDYQAERKRLQTKGCCTIA